MTRAWNRIDRRDYFVDTGLCRRAGRDLTTNDDPGISRIPDPAAFGTDQQESPRGEHKPSRMRALTSIIPRLLNANRPNQI
jgi:hypothetical protein